MALFRCHKEGPLHSAAERGDLAEIQRLLKKGADPNAPGGCQATTPIERAIRAGNLEAAQYLLDHGARIEPGYKAAVAHGDLTILAHLLDRNPKARAHYRLLLARTAARKGSRRILTWMFERDSRDLVAVSGAALCSALEARQADLATWLLEQGADPNAIDDQGSSPLHLIRGDRATELARILLAAGARVNAIGSSKSRPLHNAVRGDDPALVELLLANGAEVDPIDGFDRSPLEIAASLGRLEMVELLLAAGARVDRVSRHGSNALAALCQELLPRDRPGLVATAAALIDAGADPNAREGNGATALMNSVWRGNPDLVRLLLERGAHVNARAALVCQAERSVSGAERTTFVPHKGRLEKTRGWTALHMAALNEDARITKILLQSKADLNAASIHGRTPLRVAVDLGRHDTLDLLMKWGANPHKADDNGRTPLHAAAAGGRLQAAQKLLAAKLDLNAKDDNGQTPLILACQTMRMKEFFGPPRRSTRKPRTLRIDSPEKRSVAKLLLQAGADPNISDAQGRTALHWAAEAGMLQTVELLLQAGAKVRARDNSGQTALSLTRKTGHSQIVKALACWAKRASEHCFPERAHQIQEQAKREAEARQLAIEEAAEAKAAAAETRRLEAARKQPARGWLENREIERFRELGVRTWARVVRKNRKRKTAYMTDIGKMCSQDITIEFKSPSGKIILAQLCNPFGPDRFRSLKVGDKIDVVYIPESLMQVEGNTIASEVSIASLVWD